MWAVDSGRLSNGSAAEDFNGEVRTSADRFSRRQNAEKSHAAVQRAISRGVVPWPNVPPGYDRGEGELLVPNGDAGSVVEAFRIRDAGATIDAVRAFLAEHGIQRSYHGVGSMLESRLYLGEIHFGASYEPNLSAHPPIIDRDLWNRVQRMTVPRGRKAKSERLLARLGVLRCESCGARMVVGSSNHGRYWIYRCPPTGDCERRVTISAEAVETIVIDRVRAALADAEGRASVEDNAREAEAQLERAQANLNATISAFTSTGVKGETAAVERLAELSAVRDQAQERVDHLGGQRSVVTINAAEDWDRLSLDARRALVRATVAEVRVAPGRGADRVTVELVGE